MLFLSPYLAISGNYDFLAIGLAGPPICQQVGHSAMFVGHLRRERYVSNRYCVSYKYKRNFKRGANG